MKKTVRLFSVLTAVCMLLTLSFAQAESKESWVCPNCGSTADSKFCPDCGQPAPTPTPANDGSWLCPNCGNTISSKFCPDCGQPAPTPTPANDGSWLCSNCNEIRTAKFCPDCGHAAVFGNAPAVPEAAAPAHVPADDIPQADASDFRYEELQDGTIIIKQYCGDEGDVHIPGMIDGKPVTVIGEYAFAMALHLNSVSIPDSVTSIEKYAFASCIQLTGVSLPDALLSIGDHAFKGCRHLISITIPAAVTFIGKLGISVYSQASDTDAVLPAIIVTPGSYAEQYCIENDLPYKY